MILYKEPIKPLADNCLLLDTSFERGVVAVAQNGRILAENFLINKLSHGQELCGAISECLKKASIKMSDLDRIAVGIGPGSFVGLRVALAQGKGMSFALAIPLNGFCTLTALLASVDVPCGEIMVVMRQGQSLYFTRKFMIDENGLKYLSESKSESSFPKLENESFLISNEQGRHTNSHQILGPTAKGLLASFTYRFYTEQLSADCDESLTLTPCYTKPPNAVPNFKPLVLAEGLTHLA